MNNINVTNFEEDLYEGKGFEREVLNKLKKKYPKSHLVDGNFKDFDILVPETGQRIEAKHDRRTGETGNFFIEYSFNGTPSGLATTKSDWYVIGTYMWWTWIITKDLKRNLRDKISCWGRSITGKDGAVVEGIVVPTHYVWKWPSTIRQRVPSYESMAKEFGLTVEDMKIIDESV